jgi:hypothetical protein
MDYQNALKEIGAAKNFGTKLAILARALEDETLREQFRRVLDPNLQTQRKPIELARIGPRILNRLVPGLARPLQIMSAHHVISEKQIKKVITPLTDWVAHYFPPARPALLELDPATGTGTARDAVGFLCRLPVPLPIENRKSKIENLDGAFSLPRATTPLQFTKRVASGNVTGGKFLVFDCADPDHTYHERRAQLETLFHSSHRSHPSHSQTVQLVPVVPATEITAAIARWKSEGFHGCAFRRLTGRYTAGQSPDLVFCRFDP